MPGPEGPQGEPGEDGRLIYQALLGSQDDILNNSYAAFFNLGPSPINSGADLVERLAPPNTLVVLEDGLYRLTYMVSVQNTNPFLSQAATWFQVNGLDLELTRDAIFLASDSLSNVPMRSTLSSTMIFAFIAGKTFG